MDLTGNLHNPDTEPTIPLTGIAFSIRGDWTSGLPLSSAEGMTGKVVSGQRRDTGDREQSFDGRRLTHGCTVWQSKIDSTQALEAEMNRDSKVT